jgi:tetratricopeptide (TPR) repeat protein
MYRAKDVLDTKYEIVSLLGEGGFGQVYLAKDLLLQQRKVAIKILKTEDTARRIDFIREMQFLTQLHHPQIISFHHYFIHGDRLHLVMEYCPGGNLWAVLKESKVDVNSAMQWGIEIAEILEFVHEKRIVHHDIKPGNILLAEDGKLKIGNFGVANRAIGTVTYMPPEAFIKNFSTGDDPRADIYALGITLLELLTGGNPLLEVPTGDLLQRKLRHDFIPTDLPRWVQELLLKATHPTPELRFQTMADFKEAMISRSVPFVLNRHRMTADDLAEKADAAIKKKKWKVASKFIEQALYCCADSVKALIAAGRFRIRVNRFSEAGELFSKALQLNARADVQKELGWIALEQGSYPKALSMLSDYLYRHASDYEAVNLLMQCYYETERFEQAADLAKSVSGKSPCFKNNCVISQILAGLLSINECKDFVTDANPFLRYNAMVATEEPRAWGSDSGARLKDKLLFQDYRFTSRGSDKNFVSVKAGAENWDFQDKIIGLGRSDRNELVIPLDSVSRRHCAIIDFPEDVWVYDLNSTAGTFVDDKRLKRKQFVVGVHKVKIADWEFEIASSSDLLL